MNFKDLRIQGGSASGGFAYSRSISDIDITANAITKSVDWELIIKNNAQKKTVTFEPSVAFDCPTGKSSIVFDVCCVYNVDSWNTLPEDIVSEKSILCTISSAAFN